MSDSYPRLQRSRDEPEPANVSRIKTEPDRHTPEFCHSVCHPFASKPNLRRSPTPQMMGVGRILSVNVRLCNSSKCHSSSNATAAALFRWPARAFATILCALRRGDHGNPKHIHPFSTKGYSRRPCGLSVLDVCRRLMMFRHSKRPISANVKQPNYST